MHIAPFHPLVRSRQTGDSYCAAVLSTMSSTSDRGEDNDLDTKDVQLAITEEHFVEPPPSDTNASTRPLRPAPKEASGNPEASAQGRVTSDPLSTAGARRLAFKRYGSAVSGGEDPLTEERHSEHKPSSAVGMGWVVKEYGLQVSVFRHHSGLGMHSLTGLFSSVMSCSASMYSFIHGVSTFCCMLCGSVRYKTCTHNTHTYISDRVVSV